MKPRKIILAVVGTLSCLAAVFGAYEIGAVIADHISIWDVVR